MQKMVSIFLTLALASGGQFSHPAKSLLSFDTSFWELVQVYPAFIIIDKLSCFHPDITCKGISNTVYFREIWQTVQKHLTMSVNDGSLLFFFNQWNNLTYYPGKRQATVISMCNPLW